MNKIQLIALDLDGTLFDSRGQISRRSIETIRRAAAQGIHVVISTGRPFAGIPFEQIKDTGIAYAITTNGAALYEIATGRCLHEEPLDEEVVFPILSYLLDCDIHLDAFIGGKGYSPSKCLPAAYKLDVPPSLKDYIINTRTRVDNLPQFIQENNCKVQKMTLNFYPDGQGGFTDRKRVQKFLAGNPAISLVSGGFDNLELTRAGVDKGVGLHQLAEILGVDPKATLAIGDSENDLAILKAAAVGVAMENAPDSIKAQADYVTASNDEDGVARAVEHFIFGEAD
jgi:hypothetical protein